MFWIPLMIAAASSMAQGAQQRNQQKYQNKLIDVENARGEVNTAIANKQQEGNSTISAAKGALGRFNQSYQTNEALRSYGDDNNKRASQRVELVKQMTQGSFQTRLALAGEQGALAARSGGAGVAGGTVDMLSATMELSSAMNYRSMEEDYTSQMFAMDEADEENLYNQMGLIMQQDVILDDVAATAVIGPPQINHNPVTSWGSIAVGAGLSALQAGASNGMFDKGGAASNAANSVKSWFGGSSGASQVSAGANSFYQIGGRI